MALTTGSSGGAGTAPACVAVAAVQAPQPHPEWWFAALATVPAHDGQPQPVSFSLGFHVDTCRPHGPAHTSGMARSFVDSARRVSPVASVAYMTEPAS